MIFKALPIQDFRSFVEASNRTYSEDEATELMILGLVSLCVTLSNVLCVVFTGYVFLRIKIEVAPVMTDEERQFWKHDIPIARDYNKTLHAEEGKKLQEELAVFREHESENFKGVGIELLKQNFYPNTWTSPSTLMRYHQDTVTNRTSMRELESYYKSLGGIDTDDKQETGTL
jgi:hypothetical protein